ncbi:hypothetical protein SELMODRAFT_103065 [Selaginella moellendorffii]|uniref:Pentacotripeptide-repeat region of PRORP domain-containing protein n=1 Tax=Selaginella moellendorffii TaxID=88036 RepID=D8RWJ2_SELML|nr:hypothetical protein SELMODRAFT_103065 [Selaginella moellendorffii]
MSIRAWRAKSLQHGSAASLGEAALLEIQRLAAIHREGKQQQDRNLHGEQEIKDHANRIRQCGRAGDLAEAERVHAAVLRSGLGGDRFLSNLLVEMYGRCGGVEGSRTAFDAIESPNVYSDIFLGTAIVNMYGKCGSIHDAEEIFFRMEHRDVVAWNAMLSAYAHNGYELEAAKLFQEMEHEGVKADRVVFVSLLEACSKLGDLEQGKVVHGRVTELGFEAEDVLGHALVNLYGKCGALEEARSLFGKIVSKNVVSWNVLITAYLQNGLVEDALKLFTEMALDGTRPDDVTFNNLVNLCTGVVSLEQARILHRRLIESEIHVDAVMRNAVMNLYVKAGSLEDARAEFYRMEVRDVIGNTLITSYGQCGNIDASRAVFTGMECKNVISWTSSIVAHATNGQASQAMGLLHQMHLEGVHPNKVTLLGLIDACVSLAAAVDKNERSIVIPEYVLSVASRFESTIVLETALLNMHAKCGNVEEAERIFFEKMADGERDSIAWNAMVSAYATNGHGLEAIELFYGMVLQGVLPTSVTLTSILSGCSHAGLVGQGIRYFACMVEDHGVTPTADHMNCLVDLLGRAGWLREAEDLIRKMPAGDPLTWKVLLGACRLHGDLERGTNAARKASNFLDHCDSSPYVLLSNMYLEKDPQSLTNCESSGLVPTS